jgi:prevent-host-death family protein
MGCERWAGSDLDQTVKCDYYYGQILEVVLSSYSVADAKATLPTLINRALAGEEVIITRHGKPVAELRPTPRAVPDREQAAVAHARLRARRVDLGPGTPTSVELLNMIYDAPES